MGVAMAGQEQHVLAIQLPFHYRSGRIAKAGGNRLSADDAQIIHARKTGAANKRQHTQCSFTA